MAATISRQFLTAEDLVRAPVSPCRFMAKEAALRQVLPFFPVSFYQPIWAAARYKAWVCGRSLPGIADSNPARWHGCLSRVSVVCLSGRSLCVGMIICAEESYRVWCEAVAYYTLHGNCVLYVTRQ
jgi:hypothetical protein